MLGHCREVHVANFDYRLFLKNVFINNGLMVIFFGKNSTVPGSVFRIALFALNRYHEVFALSYFRNLNFLIRYVINRESVSQGNVLLTGFYEGE